MLIDYYSLEHFKFDFLFPSHRGIEGKIKSPDEVKRHIESHISNYQFKTHPQIHIVTSTPPDIAALNLIENHNIELLVMGTVARTGISGLIKGNTAPTLPSEMTFSCCDSDLRMKSPVEIMNCERLVQCIRQRVITGIDPQQLRNSQALREQVASQMTMVQSNLDQLLVDRFRQVHLTVTGS